MNIFTAHWQSKHAKHVYYKKKVHRQHNIYCLAYRYLFFLFFSLSASIRPSILSATIIITYSSPSFRSLSFLVWEFSTSYCYTTYHSLAASVSFLPSSHSQITPILSVYGCVCLCLTFTNHRRCLRSTFLSVRIVLRFKNTDGHIYGRIFSLSRVMRFFFVAIE